MTHKFWMQLAEQVALDSPDPKTKVGAVVLNPETEQYTQGCNYSLFHSQDWTNRPEVRDTVLHAEMDALLNYNSHYHVPPSVMYCTLLPCLNCLKHAKACGISEIYFLNTHEDLQLIQKFSKLYGVTLYQLDKDTYEQISFFGP